MKADGTAAHPDNGSSVRFLDIGNVFVEPSGIVSKAVMPDYLHPNAQGYQAWYDAMMPLLTEMLGKDK